MFKKHILPWLLCRDGATSIEYGLLAAAVGCAVVSVVFLAGDDLSSLFNKMGTSLDNAAGRVDTGS